MRVLEAESRCAILPNERSYLESEYRRYICSQSVEGAHISTSYRIQGHVRRRVQGRVMQDPSEGAVSNGSNNDSRKTDFSAQRS